MHTNLSLEPDEFDNCQIGVDTEVTFCLKELRVCSLSSSVKAHYAPEMLFIFISPKLLLFSSTEPKVHGKGGYSSVL
jgi:hypothetical protein